MFQYIRELEGIRNDDIVRSIDPKKNRFQIFKANSGAKHTEGGKSGSFFFFTQDKRYIIKSMKPSEKKKLLGMLPDMIDFLRSRPRGSLLSKIYGMYQVKIKGMKGIDLCLQRNCLDISPNNELLNCFDLKGSTFKRQAIDFEEIPLANN